MNKPRHPLYGNSARGSHPPTTARRITSASHPDLQSLCDAITHCRPFRFRYLGGTTPNATRIALPGLLYQIESPQICSSYCLAWCAVRRASRLFRIDRMVRINDIPEDLIHSFPTRHALADLEMEIRQRYRIRGDTILINQQPDNHWIE